MSALERLGNMGTGKVAATPESAFLSLVQKYGYDVNGTELYTALTTKGTQKIQAVAGSGKTTFLLFKIMYDIVTGESMRLLTLPNGNQVRTVDKVFVGTFLKSGAEELAKKLAQWQNKMGYTITASQISFGTLHAEFKRCLNAMGVATPLASDGVLRQMFRRAVDSCNIRRDGEPLKSEDYRIIESILIYYRGRLDDKRYRHPSVVEYDLTPTILDFLAKQYKSMRQAEGVMDFEDLQELLYKYLYVDVNPNVVDFVANRYNYIYLDEFQDTSQIQYAILRKYMDGCKKVVAVGDVQQCIYSFRGSDIGVMYKMFDQDYNPVRNNLSHNYRCPSNILMPVTESIKLNRESTGIEIKPRNEGGEFHIYGVYSTKLMLKKLVEGIDEDIAAGRTVGVLCRTNYDGLTPALYLEMANKYKFSISGESMTLNSPLPKSLLKVTRLFTEKGTTAVKTTLKLFADYRSGWQVNQLCDVMKQNGLSIWTVDENDLQYSCPEIHKVFIPARQVRQQFGDMEALRMLYTYLKECRYKGDSQYAESARDCIDILIEFMGMSGAKTVGDFEIEAEALNDRMLARVGKNYDIAIATVHEFKGKERDSIYVWDDSEGVFPSRRTDETQTDELEEERRVHYIACTRARKKSVIFTRFACPSMFVKEMDAKIEPVTEKPSGVVSQGAAEQGQAVAKQEVEAAG